MREPNLRALDLALAGSTLQLLGQLDDLRDACRAHRVALAEQAAGSVDRQAATEPGDAVGDQLAAVTLRAQAERLVGEDLARRRSVVQFDDREVLGPEARFLVGRGCRQVRGAGCIVVALGAISFIPGRPIKPAYYKIDLDLDTVPPRVVGLS